MGRDRGIGVRRGGLGANGYGGIEGAEWEFEWGLVLGDRGQPGMRSAEVNGGGEWVGGCGAGEEMSVEVDVRGCGGLGGTLWCGEGHGG